MKLVVHETEAFKVLRPQLPHPEKIGIKTLLWAGAHGNTVISIGPIRMQTLKIIIASESVYNWDPHWHWALLESMKYHDCGPGTWIQW